MIKKTVLITGTSRGIGYQIASDLLAAGHRVIGLSRTLPTFSPIHQDHYIHYALDQSKLSDVAKRLPQLASDHGDVDTVICNSGRGLFTHLEEFSYEQIQQIMDVNFTSHAFIARAFVPILKRKAHSDMIFIGSEAALTGSRRGAIYCASKFALRGFAQALRAEGAKSALRVTLINPGMVKTDFFNELDFHPGTDPHEHLLAQDISATVLHVLSARPGVDFEEITLRPVKHVIRFKRTKTVATN